MPREIGWNQEEIITYNLKKVLKKCSRYVGPIQYTGMPKVATQMIGAIDANEDRFIHNPRQIGWSNLDILHHEVKQELKDHEGCAGVNPPPVVPPFPHLSTFTAPNGTLLSAYVPELGDQWVDEINVYEIQSNQAVVIAPASGGLTIADLNLGPTQDYTLVVKCTILDGTSQVLVTGRYGVGKGIQYLILANSIIAYDVADGATVIMNIVLANSFVEREFKFVFSGNTVSTYVNGFSLSLPVSFNAGNNGTGLRLGQNNSTIVSTSVNSVEVY